MELKNNERQEQLRERLPHGDAMLPFMVHSVETSPLWEERVPCHWHEELEFLYIRKGNVQFQVDDRNYNAKEGDFLFLLPNQLHAMQAEVGSEVAFEAIDFLPEFLYCYQNDILQQKYFTPIFSGEILLREFYSGEEAGQREAYALLEETGSIFRQKEPGYELRIKGKVYEIFSWLFTHGAEKGQNRVKDDNVERTRDILKYLQKNYEHSVTLEELSRQFQISTGHMCRLFKKITGYSIVEYLNHYRVRVSAELLRESGLNVGEIAGQVGFNNISYYNKLFHQDMHQTPTQYRAASAGTEAPEAENMRKRGE